MYYLYSSNNIIFYNIYTVSEAYILHNSTHKRQNKYQPLGGEKIFKIFKLKCSNIDIM